MARDSEREKALTFDENGNIIDIISHKPKKDTPEERVRQNFVYSLIVDYHYPKELIRLEVPIQYGSNILTDSQGSPVRADIVVYKNAKASLNGDQGNILFVVECKKPDVESGYNQLVSYIYNTSAQGGVWTNGSGFNIYRRIGSSGLEPMMSLPPYKTGWDTSSTSTIPKKSELPRPHNIRFLLSSCHNKLYGRGMENEDFDLAMDMVRILLAKIQDETSPGVYPKFWITDEAFQTEEGKRESAEIVQKLFREYADLYPDVFEPHERIQVGYSCIAEVVGLLKNWGLAARNDDAEDWDLMGETYEQFTHINLKRQQGQFFTNRLVVNMMIRMLDPEVGERILDPAGGSGGFATGAFRYLRRKILATTGSNSAIRDRQFSTIKESVFLVEVAPRLVKIAKCAMLLTGDGQSGMTRGNSLGSYDDFDNWIKSRCSYGRANAPSVIVTNPPFSGQKADSQVTDKTILRTFAFGHSYKKEADGSYVFDLEDDKAVLAKQAPEILFLERCVDWLKPGGRMGIIMPKGFLDNVSYECYRYWLLSKCELNGVITLHKDTFQPDTGVRTCILLLTKPESGSSVREDYPIFMAQSQRIGQDSKGNPVFVLDGNGKKTDELNHDLDEIADTYEKHSAGIPFNHSELVFTVNRKTIRDFLNINPQHYSPKLNQSIERVLNFDNVSGWAVTTVGQLEAGMPIYIGPRWNSSLLKVENPSDTSKLTPFLTANAALELRRFTIKWMDESKAQEKHKTFIKMLKVEEGDILISRSGTIGKVTYATKDLADNYIVSDDLVRVRVKDEQLRAYLLAYFTSSTALDLMRRDEYGSVQQHLQPRHIQQMLIPVPDDWALASDMIKAGQKLIQVMEDLSVADNLVRNKGFDLLCSSIHN